MTTDKTILPKIEDIVKSRIRLRKVIVNTPLEKNRNLSNEYQANIFLKREDLQIVRSYKIRGAYNKMSSLPLEALKKGVVCASAGNHAQGVAYSCNKLKVRGKIYMPVTTPTQKIRQVQMFGNKFVEIILVGDSFDEAFNEAIADSRLNNMVFIYPFDDLKIIEGQGTIGLEIFEKMQAPIDYIFVPIGGGGLASGIGSYIKMISPNTNIIGVEPAGAASMKKSFEKGEVVTLDKIDTFVDGCAVARVGDLTYNICRQVIDDIVVVPEGKVCSSILKLYNEEAIVVEPAGALAIAALDLYKDQIRRKNVVCIVSGSNNDITRTGEIIQRSLQFERYD